MGRRGPAGKPKAIRDLDGGASHRPQLPNQPDPPRGELVAPEWLEGEARQLWDAYVPALQVTGLARPIDAGVLARYCDMWADWLECRRAIAKHGPDGFFRAEPSAPKTQGRVVSVREMPATSRKRKLHKELLIIEREFGLTPAARTRITVEVEKSAGSSPEELLKKYQVGHLRLTGTP